MLDVGPMLVANHSKDDDPFDLAPIIEAMTKEQKGKNRVIQEVEVEP